MLHHCVIRILGFCLLCLLPLSVSAQKQLVILKREKVIYRAYGGDEIVFSLKEAPKKIIRSYVNNVYDTALGIHDAVIPFYKIDRIYFKHRTFWQDAGPKFITAGIGIFLIDQFNTVVVQNEDASFSKNVAITAAVLTGAGVAMIVLKKKYHKLGGRYHLMMVDKESVFYKPDLREDLSGEK